MSITHMLYINIIITCTKYICLSNFRETMNGKTSTKDKKKPWMNHNRPPQTNHNKRQNKNENVPKPIPQYRTGDTTIAPVNQLHQQEQANKCRYNSILFLENKLNEMVFLANLQSQEIFYIAKVMCLSDPLVKLINGCKIYKTLYKGPYNRPVYFLENEYWKSAVSDCICEQTYIGPYTVRRTDIIYLCNMSVQDIENALVGHAITEPLSFFIHRMKGIKEKQRNKEKINYTQDRQFLCHEPSATISMPTSSVDSDYHIF